MTNEDVAISVLVPIYNAERYLEQCLDSIDRQTFTDYEVICINDGSTDGSETIIDQFVKRNPRFRKITKTNTGYGNSMNVGLDAAKGRYISIVESDDFIEHDMLEELYKVAVSRDTDVVKCSYWDYYDGPGGGVNVLSDNLRFISPDRDVFDVYDHPNILRYRHPSIWCCLYSSSFLKNTGIKFIEPPGAGWADNPFFYETILKAKRISWIGRPYYHYRQTNADSSSNLLDCNIPLDRLEDLFLIMDKEATSDRKIWACLYDRAISYMAIISENESFDYKKQRARIKNLFIKMNSDVIIHENFSIGQILIYISMKNDFLYCLYCAYSRRFHIHGIKPARTI